MSEFISALYTRQACPYGRPVYGASLQSHLAAATQGILGETFSS